jgi:porphobilinogen deaminase
MAAQKTVRIGTRGSPLALAQANLFAGMLVKASPGVFATSIHPYTTTGDKILDKPLQDAGGKGLFTKELDRAQETGEIDVAVHSLKDVTVTLQPHLVLAAYLQREDPHDCLIGPWARIADLPRGAVVGTSSLRRKAQLLSARPDLKAVTFRGNVQTRFDIAAEERGPEVGPASPDLGGAAQRRRADDGACRQGVDADAIVADPGVAHVLARQIAGDHDLGGQMSGQIL